MPSVKKEEEDTDAFLSRASKTDTANRMQAGLSAGGESKRSTEQVRTASYRATLKGPDPPVRCACRPRKSVCLIIYRRTGRKRHVRGWHARNSGHLAARIVQGLRQATSKITCLSLTRYLHAAPRSAWPRARRDSVLFEDRLASHPVPCSHTRKSRHDVPLAVQVSTSSRSCISVHGLTLSHNQAFQQ